MKYKIAAVCISDYPVLRFRQLFYAAHPCLTEQEICGWDTAGRRHVYVTRLALLIFGASFAPFMKVVCIESVSTHFKAERGVVLFEQIVPDIQGAVHFGG